ncbi:hypothetical protein VIGAN_09052100 [Vigna angularis var. angularis]|uniref:Uncharacterized protein n=1 Tax=Vigna angularis var. angularis TaxID=157739 RepID=A0A0S3SWS6_PHAAN|nr:hypothetical protein VIGAN_09052100 [Vigna angularis var. angularis]
MHPHASPIAVETSENEDHHTVKRPSALHNDAIKQGLWHRKYIVKSLKAAKEDREDMLLIFSTFDNRLSDISDLINGDDSKSSKEEELDRFEVVEKMIFANASVFDEPSR